MKPIPSGRKKTNPFNFARIFYTLEAFIDEPIHWGNWRPGKLADLHRTALEYCSHPHVIASLVPINIYHNRLREKIEEERAKTQITGEDKRETEKDPGANLTGKEVILLPGTSVDNTITERGLFPGRTGADLAHESNRLSTEIMSIVRSFYEQGIERTRRSQEEFLYEFNLFMQQYIFLQLTDMIFPSTIRIEERTYGKTHERINKKDPKEQETRTVLQHQFPEILEDLETILEAEGRRPFGNGRKELDSEEFLQGMNYFSETIVEPRKAHRIYLPKYDQLIRAIQQGLKLRPGPLRRMQDLFDKEDENFSSVKEEDIKRKITKVLAYDKQMIANAYANLFRLIEPRTIHPYAKKTSYVFDILKRIRAIEDIDIEPFGEDGIMKNTNMSLSGESDPAALRILEGWLGYELQEFLDEDLGIKSRYPAKRWYVKQEQEPGSCNQIIQCSHIRTCSRQAKASERRCALDYLNNEFTEQDIAQTLRKIKGITDPKIIREVYKEHRFSEEERIKLLEDMRENRYLIPGSVHQDLRMLESGKDFLVFLLNNENPYRTRSWVAMNGKEMKVRPLPIPDIPAENYQLRSSEFGTSCYLSRLISKVDDTKLDRPIEENDFAIIGTATHKLWNQRPWLHYLERPDDNTPHVMEWCERRLAYTIPRAVSRREKDITVMGSSDAVAFVESKNGTYLLILDRKRANYYKQAFNVQTMLYNLAAYNLIGDLLTQTAILQASGTTKDFLKDFQGFFIGINHRPFVSVIEEPLRPEIILAYAAKEDPKDLRLYEQKPDKLTKKWVRGLDEIIIRNYDIQRRMVADHEYLLAYRARMKAKGACSFRLVNGETMECLNAKKCEATLEAITKGKTWEELFYKGVDLR